jgi:hypothetical protein
VVSFKSAQAKLARANAHLETLETEFREFFGGDPYSVTHEFDYLEGKHRWRADLTEPVPVNWPLLIGDCVHNLRSALDHLAWQLAGAKPDDRTTMFPIFDDPARFEKHGRWRLKTVPRRPRALIEWLQPCRRADPTDDLLFLIEVFDAEDKHKTITLTGAILDRAQIVLGAEPPPAGSHLQMQFSGENYPVYASEPDAVLAEGTALLLGPDGASAYYMEVDMEFTFGVAMTAEAKGITVARANEILREASERVGTILQMFDRYAA